MKITDDVYALDATRGNYAYAILGPEVTLIDTGRPGQGQRILDELLALNVQPKAVRQIYLTHHDGDHIGSAAFLQRATGAKVWASQDDLPYILAEKPRPGIKRLASLLMRPEVPARVNPFPRDNSLPGIKIIPTPGHTPGHVCFLYKDVLFAGDLFFGGKGKLGLSPAIMTWDMALVKESARKVAAYPFHWVCMAHGSPMERGDLLAQYG
jgi:glyoxylase-like metal-dependent hydrolase (beta-lactamase superfamily II)